MALLHRSRLLALLAPLSGLLVLSHRLDCGRKQQLLWRTTFCVRRNFRSDIEGHGNVVHVPRLRAASSSRSTELVAMPRPLFSKVFRRSIAMGRTLVRTLLRAFVACFCLACAVLFAEQRQLIFHPGENVVVPPVVNHEADLIVLSSGKTNQVHVAVHYRAASVHAPTLVFFHGNADQLGYTAAAIGDHFQRHHGIGVFGIEYPGYGVARPGSPTETSIYDAADELLNHLVIELGVDNSRLVLLGQSMGCAVAVEMARRSYGSKMILLSPFTSLVDMACDVYPFLTPVLTIAPALVRDRFDNCAKAVSLNIPTLVIHGNADEVVPVWMGHKLAGAIPNARMLEVPRMGHAGVFAREDVLDEILSWTDPFVIRWYRD